jgi:hypothetical protein
MKIDTTQANKIPYGPAYLYRIAEFVAAQVPGTKIDEAKTTESVYIYLPNAKAPVRLAFHRNYPSNYYPSAIAPKTKKGLPVQLDKAIRAAIVGAKRHQDVPTWEMINA